MKKFDGSMKISLALSVKLVTWKFPHLRHRYWIWFFGEFSMVQSTENPHTYPQLSNCQEMSHLDGGVGSPLPFQNL